ncbi:PilN domain-containing protein [Solimonas sp. SE-A11]|uniref:PilN domain-containing protein n=1 Tax=Solimonas sp. SE-A11 TaxID=3054954 RepID=UPI00259C9D61|nr:PilN domain-containing protein [Solimonas sp. SE-A11]MDM4770537.1 PilN domain-containing protein [Solimonas sp. SE-A11]
MTTRINLLDWRAERRAKRKQQFLSTLGLGVLASAAIVGLAWSTVSGAVSSQQERNTYLQRQIDETEQKIKEIQELEKVRDNLLARMRVIEELQASRSASVHFFDEIVSTLPDGVSIRAIKQTPEGVTIDGTAESNGRVSTYMKNLEASRWFQNPMLVVIKTSEQEQLRRGDFQLRVKALKAPSDASSPAGSERGVQ